MGMSTTTTPSVSAAAAAKATTAAVSTATATATASTLPSTTPPPTTETETQPSILDVRIRLTFVDQSGARRKTFGIIGKTLHEACMMQNIEIGDSSCGHPPERKRTDTWYEPSFGIGPTSGFDHVVLVGNGVDTAPRITNIEQDMIQQYWPEDEIFENSRLASCIVLTKEMDGMIVYVPDRLDDVIP